MYCFQVGLDGLEVSQHHQEAGRGGEEDQEEEGEGEEEAVVEGGTTVRKGLLWQQRDKLFSRWKERYFILTKVRFCLI